MADDLSGAIEQLRRKLDEQTKAATETKQAINLLLKMSGQPAQFSDTDANSATGFSIRPDQFYGKPLATAAQEYLESRKQAVQPEEILRGLEAGGYDFEVVGWKGPDRLRNLAISMAKNTVKFHRLKNGSFGLKSWYDADFLKRAAKQKQANADEAAENACDESEKAAKEGK
ncbi:MAG: hypothetical protein WA213_08425 [Terriglobales bacterium]